MPEIAYCKIHPAIGIARVGNGDEFFYAPETPDEMPKDPGFYKDTNSTAKIKRQAARFRVYGYDENDQVTGEVLDGLDGATVEWTAHLANTKAAWYEFTIALDIPEAQRLDKESYGHRNAKIPRDALRIDPGARTIQGRSQGDAQHQFNGTISANHQNTPVYLGELRTDEKGRLVVLGGRGASASFTTPPSELTTFGNNDGWHDDISDGPVTATVTVGGKQVDVRPSWVVVAPPNYAPDVKGIVTLHDLLYDMFVQGGALPFPDKISFAEHVEPLLLRFSRHQWVNAGFAAEFGWRGPNDFSSADLPAGLGSNKPQYQELRRRVYYQMRDYDRDGLSPLPWPWLYGDAMATPAQSPRQYSRLTATLEQILELWVQGTFDDTAPYRTYSSLQDAPVGQQPGLLDRAALEYCLADAFHPGCEVTWPIRHDTLYSEPFRIRHRADAQPGPDYGDYLPPERALSATGPLHEQGPGDLTRWMGLPWQTDTASCRAGYELRAHIGPRYSPYLPTFWPARVPNHVLTQDDFDTVTYASADDDTRQQAFENRAVWCRFLNPDKKKGMQDMISMWPKLGIVETHPYTVGDGMFPQEILVESTPDPSLPTVPDHQNLINVHVPEAAVPEADDAHIMQVGRTAARRVAESTEFDEKHISAGYVAKADPFGNRG
ncbi:LodA/GoxA family CTQ-dependent oxidase [Streptomyces sp. PRKS01-29]|nr:LodA/GoxA family CTQ-dependent oxidase [Streptomyces sabulosicollis]MBI0295185.1 LodA/GoxA family CTQ-dependent oxidase [Streptomyces sabulosicollis]